MFIPFIYFFYLETAGLSLDEIDRVFDLRHAPGVKMTYKEATRHAKDELEAERLRIRSAKSQVGEKEMTEHVEEAV